MKSCSSRSLPWHPRAPSRCRSRRAPPTPGALPLAVLLALIACLLVATSIGQLAKHLPSAGSIYTYPAEAIHPAPGFLVGWGYALVEALIGPITMVLFGYLIGSITNSEFGWPFTTTWVTRPAFALPSSQPNSTR